MKQNISMFIGNQEVEFNQPPEILMTFQRTDYTNPTVVKVGYSKSIEIEGTPINNQIFSSIFDLTRIQNPIYFNPSKKVECRIYENGDLMQEGYIKLDKVTKNQNKITYSLTLYCGLNDFFYNLSYKEDGTEYKLNSLDFGEDLSFEISRNTIKEAWSNNHPKKWDIINFAPCYNGIPDDDFDANKVLIQRQELSKIRYNSGNNVIEADNIPATLSDNGITYKSYNGYFLGEMTEKRNEWEMRELRSYLQRPVLSIKALFDAVGNPNNNGGYSLVLDDKFFNKDNPYYSNAWMTLSMLTSLKTTTTSKGTKQFTLSNRTYTDKLREVDRSLEVNYSFTNDSTIISDANGELEITWNGLIGTVNKELSGTGYTLARYNISSIYQMNIQKGAVAIQFAGIGDNNDVVTVSDVYWITSKWEDTDYLKQSETRYTPMSEANAEVSVKPIITTFDAKYENGKSSMYITGGFKPKFTLRVNEDVKGIRCRITYIFNYYPRTYDGGGKVTYMPWIFDNNGEQMFLAAPDEGLTMNVDMSNFAFNEVHSYSNITQNDLMSIKGTVAGWLISYCKLFNLYFEKDIYSKTVYIRKRTTWYDGRILDIDNDIDRSKDVELTPIPFDYKWYEFKFTDDSRGRFQDEYLTKYGYAYGSFRVNTGYDFATDTKDLLDGNLFKNAVQVLENSPRYDLRLRSVTESQPTYLNNWITLSYYNDNLESKEIKVTGQALSSSTLNDYAPYYDLFSKPQLHDKSDKALDGYGVLLFNNGNYPLDRADSTVDYVLTDDTQEMISLNGKPCWLSTTDESYPYTTEIPFYSRQYIPNLNTMIPTYTLDFGAPREIYAPETKGIGRTIYEGYWKNYIEDMYDVNSKVIDCYVHLKKEKVEGDLLRHFYWFDNSIWVLIKITDYNVTGFDTTKCRFVKVLDMNSYLQ